MFARRGQLSPWQRAQAYAILQGGNLAGGSGMPAGKGTGSAGWGSAPSAGTMGGMGGGFTMSGVSLGGTSPNMSGGYTGGNLGNLGTAPSGGFLHLGGDDDRYEAYGYKIY